MRSGGFGLGDGRSMDGISNRQNRIAAIHLVAGLLVVTAITLTIVINKGEERIKSLKGT